MIGLRVDMIWSIGKSHSDFRILKIPNLGKIIKNVDVLLR